jgi:hypothetical protein
MEPLSFLNITMKEQIDIASKASEKLPALNLGGDLSPFVYGMKCYSFVIIS